MHQLRKYLTREQIFTIPNFMSFFRLAEISRDEIPSPDAEPVDPDTEGWVRTVLASDGGDTLTVLLPFIVWTYWKGSYDVAVGLLILSAITDALDGVIARKFNMVSDLGKMLDPLSDKLTHAALLVCLASRYRYIWIVFAFLAVKEFTMFFLGAAAIRHRGAVHSAQWYGKVCTVILETVMAALILFPQIPERLVILLLCLCCAAMLFSLVMYVIYLCGLIRAGKAQQNTLQGEANAEDPEKPVQAPVKE